MKKTFFFFIALLLCLCMLVGCAESETTLSLRISVLDEDGFLPLHTADAADDGETEVMLEAFNKSFVRLKEDPLSGNILWSKTVGIGGNVVIAFEKTKDAKRVEKFLLDKLNDMDSRSEKKRICVRERNVVLCGYENIISLVIDGIEETSDAPAFSMTYKSTDGASYTFSENEFIVESFNVFQKGTYTIKQTEKGKRIFLFVKEVGVDDNIRKQSYVIGGDDGVSYEEGDDFIVISRTKYYLQ